jgi:ditrans,polycis-polyprenyl diphosphate synthase
LLPTDLQDLILKAMDITSKNKKATLNVAFSYTSRDEMTNAVKTLATAVDKGIL